MAQYLWGDTGAPLPVLEYACLDPSWVKYLPRGCTIISNVGYGSSYWSQPAEITVRLADGTTQAYLLKLSETHVGRIMAEGEFESMSELYRVAPELVPRPLGWGTYESSQDVHWYLAEFVNLEYGAYPVADFCALIADMHKRSKAFSPDRFGFQVPTCNGTVVQHNDWCDSWEEFFINKLQHLFEQEERLRGPCPEYERLKRPLFEKVCPRLLRPLETGNNSLRPVLTHGDLWHGNVARQSNKPGQPCLIFDASAIWAHNEYDLHTWFGGHYMFDHAYCNEYFKHYPPSEPAHEWRDRNELYYIVSELHNAILFPKAPRYRHHVINVITKLVKKFPDGYTGPYRRKGLETRRDSLA